MTFNIDMIQNFYECFSDRIYSIRKKYDRPLTFTEKILFSHLN